MPTVSRPGIRTKPGKSRRPQRDAQGRFAAKVDYTGDWLAGRELPALPKVIGVELGQKASSQGPHAYERLRVWLAHKLIDAGLWLWRRA